MVGHYFDKGLEPLVWMSLHQKLAMTGPLLPRKALFLYKDGAKAVYLTSAMLSSYPRAGSS